MNTTTNIADANALAFQRRLQRTYEVTLTRDDATVATAIINLSYELNEDHDAVALNGQVVDETSITAKIELMNRLRKLAKRGSVNVSTDVLDDDDVLLNMRLVRASFVSIAVDPETGRPIPAYRKS